MTTLNDIRLPEASQRFEVERFLDVAFWRSMFPDLHVVDTTYMQGVRFLDTDPTTGQILEHLLIGEGYFQLGPQSWSTPIAAMAKTISELVSRGFPPAFAFVYDEFWLTYYALHPILQRLLGEQYRLLPDFWAWHVDPSKGESGWSPHRDKGVSALFDDRRPKSLTVWLPLTDATTLNGCMYIVPADRDPVYGTDREREWPTNFNYAGVRALPAQAGSILSWNQAVLHWGSSTTARVSEPRISMAFEFQRGDVEPMNTPLLTPLTVFDLPSRLRLISKQILQYRHMYPLASDLEAMATKLIGV